MTKLAQSSFSKFLLFEVVIFIFFVAGTAITSISHFLDSDLSSFVQGPLVWLVALLAYFTIINLLVHQTVIRSVYKALLALVLTICIIVGTIMTSNAIHNLQPLAHYNELANASLGTAQVIGMRTYIDTNGRYQTPTTNDINHTNLMYITLQRGSVRTRLTLNWEYDDSAIQQGYRQLYEDATRDKTLQVRCLSSSPKIMLPEAFFQYPLSQKYDKH